jgi:hypothetical protein
VSPFYILLISERRRNGVEEPLYLVFESFFEIIRDMSTSVFLILSEIENISGSQYSIGEELL